MSSYIALSSQTLGSAASSVTFSSIPTTANGKTLRDLVLVVQYLANTGSNYAGLRFNSDTGNNYSSVLMRGNGSTAGSGTGGTNRLDISFAGSTTTSRENILTSIFDFAQTNKHKSVLARPDNASIATAAIAGRWANTSAITAIEIYDVNGSSFAAGSTFYLFGIEG